MERNKALIKQETFIFFNLFTNKGYEFTKGSFLLYTVEVLNRILE